MKAPNCGATFVPLHAGHLTLAFSRSEMVMMISNGFVHSSHINSYLGMVILPGQSAFRRAERRSVHLQALLAALAHELLLGHRLPPVVSNSAGRLSLPGDEVSYLGQKQLQRLHEGSHCRTSRAPSTDQARRHDVSPSRRGGRNNIRARRCYVRRPARHTADHVAVIRSRAG